MRLTLSWAVTTVLLLNFCDVTQSRNILYMADSKYHSHFNLAIQIANTIHRTANSRETAKSEEGMASTKHRTAEPKKETAKSEEGTASTKHRTANIKNQVDFVVAVYKESVDKRKDFLRKELEEYINVIYVEVGDDEGLMEIINKNNKKQETHTAGTSKAAKKTEKEKKKKTKEEEEDLNDWSKEVFGSHDPNYWRLMRIRSVSFYNAIVKDPFVDMLQKLKDDIPRKLVKRHIWKWLQYRNYFLGVAEFGHSTSAFAVFYQLGITNTISVSATPLLPAFYQYLGVDIAQTVPEHYTAIPGDGNGTSGIRLENSKRQNDNKGEYTRSIGIFTTIYETEYKEYYEYAGRYSELDLRVMPPLTSLLNNVRYCLVNHHPVAAIRRITNEKIKYVGGIEVEAKGLYKKKLKSEEKKKIIEDIEFSSKVPHDAGHVDKLVKAECIVIFSLGTIVGFQKGITSEDVKRVFNAFEKIRHCHFIVRIDEKLAATAINSRNADVNTHKRYENIHIVHKGEMLDQAKLLEVDSVHGLIHHGGQNTLTEALYAGVPMIIIPFFGDQRYNAAVVEYMGVGLWIKHTEFGKELENKKDSLDDHLEKLLGDGETKTEYRELAERVGDALLHGKPQKRILEKIIKEALKLRVSEDERKNIENAMLKFKAGDIKFVQENIQNFEVPVVPAVPQPVSAV